MYIMLNNNNSIIIRKYYNKIVDILYLLFFKTVRQVKAIKNVIEKTKLR